MKSTPFLAALIASLAPVAQAGQHFSFTDPISTPSYSTAMYQTASLYPDYSSGAAAFKNLYGGNVTLTVDNFDALGNYMGSKAVPAMFFVGQSASNVNDQFVGTLTSGVYATGPGWMTFVNPKSPSEVYLQVYGSKTALTYGGFAAAESIAFSGSLFDTTETGDINASFLFPNSYGTGATTRHTGPFTASIGTIGTVQATPEPAPLLALAIGAAALRRRRR